MGGGGLHWLWRAPARASFVVRGEVLRYRLERHLNRLLGDKNAVRIVSSRDAMALHHVRLFRDGRVTLAGFDYWRRLGRDGRFRAFSTRLGPVIAMFRKTRDVAEAMLDVSDGGEARPGFIGYDTRIEETILVPDHEFCANRGYRTFRQAALGAPRWPDRRDAIVWRGTTTGSGIIARDTMSADDATLLPRTRMCLLLRDQPGVDCKFTGVVQSSDRARDEVWLRAAGLFGERVVPYAWRNLRYALAIDGNASPWSNLFTRLLLGCCVIRVASPSGYRQWYHADLRAWEHYVPVASDLSDLVEKIDWCRAHPAECAAVADRGQQFARQRTYETEFDAAVERIETALGPGGPFRRG